MNILDNLLLKFETDTNLSDFLMKKYVKKVPVVPDDDIPEHFDRWLGNLTDEEAMELLKEFEENKMKLSRPPVKIGDRVKVFDSWSFYDGQKGEVIKIGKNGDIFVQVKNGTCEYVKQWELIKRGRPKKKNHICDITKKTYKELREENAKLKQRIGELEKPVACKHKFIIKDFNNNPVYNFVAVCKKCLLLKYI